MALQRYLHNQIDIMRVNSQTGGEKFANTNC